MNMARIATTAVLAPVFILTVWRCSFPLFIVLIELFCAVSFLEYARMAQSKGIKILRFHGLLATLIMPLAFIQSAAVIYVALAVTLVSILSACVADTERGAESFIFTVAGVLYIGVCYSAAVLIRKLPEGEKLFLLICFATWGADIGAYYIGRLFGRIKLAPSISPGKTVEGCIGGLLLSVAFSFGFAFYLFKPALGETMLAAGFIGGFIGPIGDLSESMLKRFFGQKDSGSILPGHGGLLDRADALLFTAPAFFIFLVLRDGLF